MEPDGACNSGAVNLPVDEESYAAVNSSVLNYYKKFGRKSNLEQYFSLSTAQSDIRDPTSLFWRRMKSQSDSSDSGDKKSASSTELCRISIKCTIPETSSSQDENPKAKNDSESPPIITEEVVPSESRQSDYESVKSDEGHSQRSADATLDISANKPLSPTSSITSQRKLEWDSLGDVGYANESDMKTSASSLSTLERLALKQQYSNNDSRHSSHIGGPTAHSTPVEQSDTKTNANKGLIKRSTKIYKKDVDYVEVNMPHSSELNASQAINVNLTKHISFNVERDGGVTIENVKQDVTVSPEKATGINVEEIPQIKIDKEIQTTLTKSKERSGSSVDNTKTPKTLQLYGQGIPVLINLNTLKARNRRRKLRSVARKNKLKIFKKLQVDKENIPVQEKSAEQVSEAESFEYMPGHIYNQNHLNDNSIQSRPINTDNKSSLESSGVLTTDSSKNSRLSFTKDLEKNIDLLRTALEKHSNNVNLRKRLIKEVVKKLLNTKYKDDESVTDFISGFDLTNKLRDNNYTTTSTSDTNNTDNTQMKKPKKSILRVDKFNSIIPSTSQSAPNLPVASNSEIPVASNLNQVLASSNTESDISSKEKSSSDNVFAKTSSQDLYEKYMAALRREEAYKRHLKDKEMFLKQKLVNSDTAMKVPANLDIKTSNRLKDLMKDLTRNNYDDGSGDASKLEGGSSSNIDFDRYRVRKQRSHSVFTLSSGNSDCHDKKADLRKRLQCSIKMPMTAGSSKSEQHYCCCPFHSSCKPAVTDSSVQVNIKQHCGQDSSLEKQQNQNNTIQSPQSQAESPRNVARVVSDNMTGELKYVCVPTDKEQVSQEVPGNFLIYKCSRLTNRGVQLEDTRPKFSNACVQCTKDCSCSQKSKDSSLSHSSGSKEKESKNVDFSNIVLKSSDNIIELKSTKSSQTDVNLALNFHPQSSNECKKTSLKSDKEARVYASKCQCGCGDKNKSNNETNEVQPKTYILQSTRWTQTEISLTPKLSDPTLSDIVVIGDADCVRLISEQRKEIAESNSKKDNITCEHVKRAGSPKISKNAPPKCNASPRGSIDRKKLDDAKNKTQKGVDKTADKKDCRVIIETPKNTIDCKKNEEIMNTITSKERQLKSENCSGELKKNSDPCSTPIDKDIKFGDSKEQQTTSDNLTIPIQGTNMTLKVSIGSNMPVGPVEMKNNETQAAYEVECITDKIHFAEKATCLTGNSSKGVKCQTTEFFNQVVVESPHSAHFANIAPVSELNKEGAVDTTQNTFLACVIKEGLKYNTYPKGIQLKERKSIVRSNTDTALLDPECCIQTDRIHITDAAIQQECPIICDESIKTVKNSQSSNSKCCSEKSSKIAVKPKISSECEQTHTSKTSNDSDKCSEVCTKDPVIAMIEAITKRYSKKDAGKTRRKKCFKEIMTVMRYLLDTEDSTDQELNQATESSSARETDCECRSNKSEIKQPVGSNSYQSPGKVVDKDTCESDKNVPPKGVKTCEVKELVDKGIQLPSKMTKNIMFSNTESSDIPFSTDIPGTSSDSATCKVLNKIKRECEKYHQRRCKYSYNGTKKCDISSSTSVNCDQCKRVHHCPCRGHKCKGHRHKSCTEKIKKKCVAYNLIIKNSDSVVSEDVCSRNRQRLENIVVKVPRPKVVETDACGVRVSSKVESDLPQYDSPHTKTQRSRSLPNDNEVYGYCRGPQAFTVRDYLEQNRPDFVEKSSNRQNCLKFISESRANERAAQRQLLSMQLEKQQDLKAISATELKQFAKELGVDIRRKKLAPKFISEREMKKHSEKIYKSLAEVVQKKEEARKENIKKTNLLMAHIFKKNLQKKTLRGDVNLSNYNNVIKI